MENGTYLNLDGQFILSHAKSGYWVAVHKYDSLDDTITGDYVGVWTNPESGVMYLDRSVWVADKADAIALGKQQGQLAIWDCANETEIWLNEFFAEQFAE
jgi:hypothetical protein